MQERWWWCKKCLSGSYSRRISFGLGVDLARGGGGVVMPHQPQKEVMGGVFGGGDALCPSLPSFKPLSIRYSSLDVC